MFKNVIKMFHGFILHVTTVCLQAVFDLAKNVANVLTKTFLKRKLKHETFYNVFPNVLVYT